MSCVLIWNPDTINMVLRIPDTFASNPGHFFLTKYSHILYKNQDIKQFTICNYKCFESEKTRKPPERYTKFWQKILHSSYASALIHNALPHLYLLISCTRQKSANKSPGSTRSEFDWKTHRRRTMPVNLVRYVKLVK